MSTPPDASLYARAYREADAAMRVLYERELRSLSDLEELPAASAREFPKALQADLAAIEADLAASDARVRVAALCDMRIRGCDALLARCTEMSFDDSDACVRGAAWIAIADAWRSPARRDAVLSILANEMCGRISIRPAALEEGMDISDVATLLIDGLSQHLETFERGLNIPRIGCVIAYAGADAAAIQQGPESAVRFLTHPKATRRLAALRAIIDAGVRARHLASQIHQVATHDADLAVRWLAVLAYAAIKAGSGEADAAKFFAQVTREVENPVCLRLAAYRALYDTLGISGTAHVEPISKRLAEASSVTVAEYDDMFEEMVDWEFVDRHIGE